MLGRMEEGFSIRSIDEVDAPIEEAVDSTARMISSPARETLISIIDSRALGGEALRLALHAESDQFRGETYTRVSDWRSDAVVSCRTSAILLVIGAADADDPDLVDDLQALSQDFPQIPTVVVGEIETPAHIAKILGHGARGSIPTSVGLGVAIGALSLVKAGGVFVPASTLLNANRADRVPSSEPGTMLGLTERQTAVAEGLSQGKPNKIIAYELNLCESTVKVHIRAIMRKLQARNRTEVAFKLHAMQPRPASSARSWMSTGSQTVRG
ncbi:response regulator transcription factor [Inquilinus sp. OTU3971]|uniref:response regulator transcription factor n=1 Tax=Inquilinus sp. OTU3971 TaxID=3043855 RepID=UPI00313D51D1